MKTVMIVAAEASSALFAERLLEHWRDRRFEVSAFGVGTAKMEKLGFERFGQAEEMAIVGFAEVIRHYRFLKSVFDRLVEEALKRRPQVVVLLDYPEFNMRLAKELHRHGINVVYYVSPQVWAWRQGRIKKIKEFCREVFLLFPFEVDFYRRHGVPYRFVGHPILDEISPDLLDENQQDLRRSQCGFSKDEIVVGLMPGSRRMEIEKLFALQLDVARRLCQRNPRVRILILVAPTIEKEDLAPYLEDVRFPFVMMKDEPARMIALTHFVLAASGTATLMVGLLKKPMVIMYRLNALTAFIARRVVSGFFGLPNLILGREVVPERFQEQATVEHLTDLMSSYLDDPALVARVRGDLAELPGKLGDKGATVRVAQALEEYLKE